MTSKIIFSFSILVVFNFTLSAQPGDSYSISGKISGLAEGEKAIMTLSTGSGFWDFVSKDSSYVKDGTFKLHGAISEGPRLYWLRFSKHPDQVIRLLVNRGENITISSGNINQIPHNFLENIVQIDGGNAAAAWRYLIPPCVYYLQAANELNNSLGKIQDSIGFDRSLVGGVLMSREILTKMLYYGLFLQHDLPYESAIPFICTANHLFDVSHHSAYWQAIYNDLSEEQKHSFYGKEFKRYTDLCVGNNFPDFALPTVEGKVLSSQDILRRGKVTIVHFWASNSDDRAAYQKELNVYYKKYHEKGLNIIGISADSIAAEWKARMIVENYPWPNVSDLKGNLKGGIVNDLYLEGGHSIPNTTNVLVDNQGKILAWDIKGVELEWYLWKYLDN